ncbi:MAG: hypothetical protein J6J17_01440 [Bacilli bacterium]|nr:hypothetical protein [Bacilli bacterium]
MKKILKVTLVALIMLVLSGCTKKYDKLTYTTYNEYFNNKDGYTIIDKSSDYDIDIIRYIEAGDGNVQMIYIEFDTEDNAINYVKDQYSDTPGYKLKLKDDYSYVKSTKDKYFKLYRVDNVVVSALTMDKKYKKNINSILKDLGY